MECGGEFLNYTELNILANPLAHYLISKGVKPNDHTALCVEPGTKLATPILSILKAGCAYVPLDPVYPSQRLTTILFESDPSFLLADFAGRLLLGDHRIPVIDMEQTFPIQLSIDNPELTK